MLIVEACYQLSSEHDKLDRRRSTKLIIPMTLDHCIVYRADHQALSAARFCRTDQLATADSC